MKVFLCVLFLCVARIYAQDGPTAAVVEEEIVVDEDEIVEIKSCLVGSVIFDGEDVTRNETLEDCPPGQDSCQTKVEVNSAGWRIYKQCKSAEACENELANNPQTCDSDQAEEKGEKLCYYCCSESGCNTDDAVPIDLSTAAPEEE